MTFTVRDMSCNHCVNRISGALKAVPGVEKLSIDLPAKRLEVEGTASAEAIVQAIREAGYTASLNM